MSGETKRMEGEWIGELEVRGGQKEFQEEMEYGSWWNWRGEKEDAGAMEWEVGESTESSKEVLEK